VLCKLFFDIGVQFVGNEFGAQLPACDEIEEKTFSVLDRMKFKFKKLRLKHNYDPT